MTLFKQTLGGNLRYKVEDDCMLSQFELYKLKSMPSNNLIEVEQSKAGEVSYTISGMSVLSTELRVGITESRMAEIVKQTLEAAEHIRVLGLSEHRIILSPNYIYVDGKTKSLRFLYLPVNGQLLGYDLLLFVKDIILQSKLDGPVRMKWDAWSSRLHSDGNYTKYIQSMPLIAVQGNSAIPDDPKTVMEDGADPLFQDWQGTPQGSDTRNFWPEEPPTTDDGESVLSDFPDYASDGMDEDEAPTGLSDDQKFDAMDKSDGTFFESMSESASNMVRARLIPLAGGNPVEITNNSFKLGRSRQRADYCIENNSISNVHATILRTGNQFSLKDNHSTNSTYVDGVKVDPDGAGTPLTNGSVIRLWKLEYRFVIL